MVSVAEYTFVSVPRTASSSIHRALGTRFRDNHRAAWLMDLRGWSFAVVREPLERLSSWFWFHHRQRAKFPMYDCEFGEWCRRGFPHHWRNCGEAGVISPLDQWQFVCDAEAQVLVDQIIPYHRLKVEWPRLLARLRMGAVELPRGNASGGPGAAAFDAEAARLAEARFRIDLHLWSQWRFGA